MEKQNQYQNTIEDSSLYNIAKSIEYIRTCQEISQAELAQKTGLELRHICQIEETGETKLEDLSKIADALDSNIEEIINGRYAKQNQVIKRLRYDYSHGAIAKIRRPTIVSKHNFEEYIYCLEGEIALITDSKRILKENEATTITAEIRHKLINITPEAIILTVTPIELFDHDLLHQELNL